VTSVSITSLDILLDWVFCDWEFGHNIRAWDRKADKDAIAARFRAINQINKSKKTIGYHWTFATAISDLIEVALDNGASKYHSWVTVATHKQAKKGGHVPVTYSTNLVSVSQSHKF
jgi:hypothetical protein